MAARVLLTFFLLMEKRPRVRASKAPQSTGAGVFRGRRRTTADSTWGLGEKAPRGTISRTSASAQKATLRASLPCSLVPGGATILSANSRWYIRTARSKGLARSLKVILEEIW
ncbi:MAG: hypothetical protein A4E51_00601 [Methanosaeta sp. PtaU1.Bin055]|nr:MAG: hypothetical protein A4E51_00601 [Methanosaeta sp. PtaU1.Bin055]